MSKSGRERARDRIARERSEQARRRRRRIWLASTGAVVVIGAAVGITLTLTGGSPAAALPLAPLSTLGTLQPAPAAGRSGLIRSARPPGTWWPLTTARCTRVIRATSR